MARRYVLVDGERRVRAALACGIPTVKAIVAKGRPSPVELLKIQGGIDIHHLRHSWGERIDLAGRLQEKTGCTVNELASMLHISQPLATKLCRARGVTPEERQALDEGRIDIEKLYILSGETDPVRRRELLHQAADMTREQLRRSTRAKGEQVEVKTSVARFQLPKKITVTVQGPRMSLSSIIDALTETVKQLRKGQSDHLDLPTLIRVLSDKAKAAT